MTATATAVRERPILFSGEMVRAILDGRKTQTRRVVRLTPDLPGAHKPMRFWGYDTTPEDGTTVAMFGTSGCEGYVPGLRVRCPNGQPGDRLWVREAFNIHAGELIAGPRLGVAYRAGGSGRMVPVDRATWDKHWLETAKWRPSIHMPRWASRITLEITEVRVERVQDISAEDARDEGVEFDVWDQALVARNYAIANEWFQAWNSGLPHYADYPDIARASFRSLWDAINGPRGYGWDANPWVWVVGFRRVEA